MGNIYICVYIKLYINYMYYQLYINIFILIFFENRSIKVIVIFILKEKVKEGIKIV